MIFGGYGRKTKTRGEVFFPCTRCSALNPFALVENYGYGQLYGVRLAKYNSNRYLLCAYCRDGYNLDKAQWDQAMIHAQGLKARGYELTMKEMAESAVELSRRVFPDLTGDIRNLLWEQLGEQKPLEAADDSDTILVLEAASEEFKVCPDCAEHVKAAARKCRYCGHEFELMAPAGGGPIESTNADDALYARPDTNSG
jgi:hypothetical protein